MRFDLVDRVLELTADRIVTVKLVSSAEEYLGDHFPTFPVLPGVLMLEAMVQAGRRLVESIDGRGQRLVLGGVRALKYGRFVTPGVALRVEVTLGKRSEDGVYDLRGEARAIEPWKRPSFEDIDGHPAAASGRFTLRPVRLAANAAVGRVVGGVRQS